MTTTNLGQGVMTWNAMERQSDRYGSVWLMHDGHTSMSTGQPRRMLDMEAAQRIAGLRGTLRAHVVDARASTHIGDMCRGVHPTTPDRGEVITLGEGVAFVEGGAVGVRPDDGRGADWLDIHAMYRAHEQLVRLEFEEIG